MSEILYVSKKIALMKAELQRFKQLTACSLTLSRREKVT
jgi:hypothetical protein